MRKKILIGAAFLVIATTLSAQNSMHQYIGNVYIFDSYEQLSECSSIGAAVGGAEPVIAPKGSLFIVDGISDDGKNLIIHFTKAKLKGDSTRKANAIAFQQTFNFKNLDTVGLFGDKKQKEVTKYFLLPVTVMTSSCSHYTPK